MKWLVANMKWVMLASGALTCTMFYAAIAPRASLLSSFGEALEGPLADLIVRNWGVLIALVGAMLIYGAFDRPSRPLVLTVAGSSKVAFIALVLSHGEAYLRHQVGVAVAIDSVMVALFVAYFIGTRNQAVT